MKPIIDKLTSMLESVREAIASLRLNQSEQHLAELEQQTLVDDFWSDSNRAEQTTKQAAELRRYVTSWRELESDLATTLELAGMSDESSESEFATKLTDLKKRFDVSMRDLKFSGEFDDRPAIVQLSAGVGGTDAQDWAQMLLNMYVKYTQRSGLKAELVDVSYGEEAGIKSATLEIDGPLAFGKFKSEKGVHRLVRLSPYNSDNLRQTSFALVDVVPEIPTADAKINEADLRIDTFRSGGHGGQSVNTTDSAVRITHIPTGTVISIQNERSQLKNKQKALSILASKLAEVVREQHLDSVAEIRGKLTSADWGSQIRSYVMQPYTKVKDHRTGHETSDVAAVLDGKIDEFIEAYLNSQISQP